MKIRNIFASVLLAGFAAVGLAAGLKEAPARKASATVSEANYAYASTLTNWGTDQVVMEYDDTRPGNIAQLRRALALNEEFKIKDKESWANSWGYDKLVATESSQYFVAGEGGNIVCKYAGTYDIFLEKDTYNIYVSYVGALTTARVYVQLQSWENTYVYAFDETTDPLNKVEPFGGFPGLKMKFAATGVGIIDQHSNNLGGVGYVDVPYVNLANTKVIISNGYSGEGNQSGNQDLNNKYYYYHTGTIPSQDLGKVSALAYDIFDVIKDGGSVCSLTKAEAQGLLDKYNAEDFYDVTCKGAFDKCTFNTYAGPSKDSNKNWTGAEVVAQLVKLASDSNPNGSLVKGMNVETKNSMIIVIAVISLIAIAGGSFLIIRRKHN